MVFGPNQKQRLEKKINRPLTADVEAEIPFLTDITQCPYDYRFFTLGSHDRMVVMLVLEPGSTPTFHGAQQRLMKRHNKAIVEIASRLAQPVFYDVQEEDEKRIES
ncbi:hypothetical protein KIN20_025356 [Parelaphostrongylus tenuis]|uniref:Uncharacterized protein n=1 Tax=Parelaphostrongylus tenuis TaxID=148309 RepID=A0AAD5MV44_PARTN|nr:hypothetical protein KIN20_025356 [Parelaphostrongylus tenuis]